MRILLDGTSLTLREVQTAAQGEVQVVVAESARVRLRAARKLVDRIAASGVPTYGINTGFGTLAEVPIARGSLMKLQRNLILSHAAGVGAPLPEREGRALILLRANVLSRGLSGVREATLDLLLALLHRGITPATPPARGHEGQARVAAELRALLRDSPLNASHQGPSCEKVQDPYSMRCAPQVHGAARDALSFIRRTLEIEANAATDNPLVFAEGHGEADGDGELIVSGGNFHGQPVSQALDLLAMAVTQLQTISERRVEQLVNPALSGLPPFLAQDSGLNSGFMMAQVTAAALAAESKILCHPACVDTIPSSAGREDHVSMGMTAALKARTVVENARSALAIELLVAAQALDLRKP